MQKNFYLLAFMAAMCLFIACNKETDNTQLQPAPSNPYSISNLTKLTKEWLIKNNKLKAVEKIKIAVCPTGKNKSLDGKISSNDISTDALQTVDAELDWDNAYIVYPPPCESASPYNGMCVFIAPYKLTVVLDSLGNVVRNVTPFTDMQGLHVVYVSPEIVDLTSGEKQPDPIVKEVAMHFRTVEEQTIDNVSKPVTFDNFYTLDGTLTEGWRTIDNKPMRLQVPVTGVAPASSSKSRAWGHIECEDTWHKEYTLHSVTVTPDLAATAVWGVSYVPVTDCDYVEDCSELYSSSGGDGRGGSSSSGGPGNPDEDLPGKDSIRANLDGPKICKNSFQFQSQGQNSITNNAKVWGIIALYQTPDGEMFNLIFGVDVTAPNNVKSDNWKYLKRLASRFQYENLWNDGDIVEKPNNGGYDFSKYAQQEIIADATDYASYHSSLAAKAGIYSSGYKKEFERYFNEWVNQYYPGVKMQILDSNVPGAISAKLTDGNPRACN